MDELFEKVENEGETIAPSQPELQSTLCLMMHFGD